MPTAIQTSLAESIRAAFGALGVDAPATVNLERPARSEHGDWSTNVALVTAKAARRNPRELAAQLKERLDASPPRHVTAVEIAGPGFLNFRLADSWLHEVLATVLAQGEESYARRPEIGRGRRVNVEYVSANPTGPLHAGHARWAAYGSALSRVLARAGYDVHQEYYVNDRGVQMQTYAASLLARKHGVELPEGGYAGNYLREWAAEMPDGLNADAALEWGRAKALDYQRDTMARMNVAFDTFSSEREIAASGVVEATLDELEARGATYRAVVAENASERADADDVIAESDGVTPATWLRTTAFVDPKRNKPFDDADRVLVKADGTYTYFLPDIAYHRDKFSRADLLIDILGADHHGYVGRMKAAMMALGHEPDDVQIIIGQLCVLMRGGEPVRLSKRTGDIIELADIIDEVGPDAARLTFLLQSIDTRQTVDLDVVVAKSLDNPVHYIHYAYARIHGIARKAAELGIVRRPLEEADLRLLTHPRELDVARVLSDLPEVVALAAAERAPHKVTTWVRELAAAYQAMYQECPVLRADIDEPLRQARFWITEACRIGIAIGLGMLGVSAPQQMDSLQSLESLDGAVDPVPTRD